RNPSGRAKSTWQPEFGEPVLRSGGSNTRPPPQAAREFDNLASSRAKLDARAASARAVPSGERGTSGRSPRAISPGARNHGSCPRRTTCESASRPGHRAGRAWRSDHDGNCPLKFEANLAKVLLGFVILEGS